MQPKDSIDNILLLPQRKLVISQSSINLDRHDKNEIFILIVEESRGSAGGRAAGSGSRRIEKIYGFYCEAGTCNKFFETDEESKVGMFDIPYSAVAMDITLTTGKPLVVQGIVDPEFINSYHTIANNLK